MLARSLRRFTRTHRQLVAAALAGCAALLAISVVRPSQPPTVEILVASRSIPAGHSISDGDVTTTRWPTDVGEAPATAAEKDVRGRITAGPIRAGEPLGETRLIGPGLLDLTDETESGPSRASKVAAPVRLADAGQAALIRPGDVVDVLAARATDGGGQSAEQVATDARVITIASQSQSEGGLLPQTGGSGDSTEPGSLIVLAVSTQTATDLAAAATRSRLSVVLKPPTPTTR